MRIKNFIFFVIKRLLIILIALLSALYFILFTNAGLIVISKLILPLVPGKLSVESIHGRLVSNIEIQNLVYSNQDVDVQIKSGIFHWDFYQLLQQKVDIKNVIAKDIFVKLHSSTSTDEPVSLAWLDYINIGNTDISNFHLHVNDQDLIINNISQQRYGSNNKIKINLLNGEILANTAIDWRKLEWSIDSNIKHINPAKLFEKFKGDINFNFKSSGVWQDTYKTILITMSDVHGSLQNYPLAGSFDLVFKNDVLNINAANLKIADAFADMSGGYNHHWNLHWKLNIPNLQNIIPDTKGNIASEGKVTGAAQDPQIQAKLNVTQLRWQSLNIDTIDGRLDSVLQSKQTRFNLLIKKLQLADYEIPEVKVDANTAVKNTTLINDFKINFNNNNQAYGHIELAQLFGSPKNQTVSGNLNFKFNDIKQIIASPYIADPSGVINGDAKISGAINSPNIIVNARLADASVKVPKFGLELKNMKLDAKMNMDSLSSNENIQFTGSLNSGTGNGQLSGHYLFGKENAFNLKLNGKDLTVINTVEYKVKADPNIELNYDSKNLFINGSIHIPKAHVRTKENNNITRLPNEVVFVNRKEQTNSQNFSTNIGLNLTVTLADQVRVSYENLKTRLAGKLTIKQSIGSLPIALGELHTVNGKYKAYGRLLKITDGRIIYNGNLITDPGIEIRAIQKFQTAGLETGQTQFNDAALLGSVYTGSNKITVGVLVKGTLNKPYLSIFSDPPGMKQSDILSYLVFGFPQANIKNAGKLSLLNQLASSMNTGGSSSVDDATRKIKKTLGLSDLSVGSVEYFNPTNKQVNTATTVNIGKKLGKKLSIHYSVGVFDSISIFNLKYQINKRLAIQTETSSSDNGADLFYEFERD